jgi:hypothetical protein
MGEGEDAGKVVMAACASSFGTRERTPAPADADHRAPFLVAITAEQDR